MLSHFLPTASGPTLSWVGRGAGQHSDNSQMQRYVGLCPRAHERVPLRNDHETLALCATTGVAVGTAALAQRQRRRKAQQLVQRQAYNRRRRTSLWEEDEVPQVRAEALKLLGLPGGATPSQARAAFRKLAKRMHPDVAGGNPSSVEAFRQVVEAYKSMSTEAYKSELALEGIRQSLKDMLVDDQRLVRRCRSRLKVWWFTMSTGGRHGVTAATAMFLLSKLHP
mmetsp:Transcript_127782/g.255206  ORF Transcript_127782/g.255206 Transcript_127782/m.255206 type:complete len:224 (+) Transcript_127782:59-730(+)